MLSYAKPLMLSLLLVIGCSLNLEPMMLSYPQTEKAVVSLNNHPLGPPLAELDAEIRSFRGGLMMYVSTGALEIDVARKVDHHLKIADYYVAAGWVQMIEGKDAHEALELGKKAFAAAMDTIVAEVSPVKQTDAQI